MTKLQKWWKPALAIVVLIVALQVGVSFLVRTHRMHAYLVAHLERAFGRQVEVSSFDARILPSPQLDANGGSTSGSNTDPLQQALQGASTTSVTNSDGSTTTSLTYADGSKVTTTSPGPTTSSSAASSSYNLVEQLIQRETNAISFSAPSLSVSV